MAEGTEEFSLLVNPTIMLHRDISLSWSGSLLLHKSHPFIFLILYGMHEYVSRQLYTVPL